MNYKFLLSKFYTCFQPTYEELKRRKGRLDWGPAAGFQPTYEELKPPKRLYLLFAGKVFSLPMRNWNGFPRLLLREFRPVFSLPMRNWNWFCPGMCRAEHLFSAYLWGIETGLLLFSPPPLHVFSLPMRNWNSKSGKTRIIATTFSAYLWGIETWFRPGPGIALCRFQPTYEELKLFLTHIVSAGSFPVFSLPMRNWNRPSPVGRLLGSSFSAYLWGIETVI